MRLNSSLRDGLSDDQVKNRLQRYGKNAPSPPQTHRFKTITGYFFKGFGSILLVASILVFIAWKPLGDPPAQANLALAIVLFAVFLIQAAFNMWQDWSSSRVMSSIKNMLPDECQVMRNGSQMTLFAADLVRFPFLPNCLDSFIPGDHVNNLTCGIDLEKFFKTINLIQIQTGSRRCSLVQGGKQITCRCQVYSSVF